MVLVTLSERPEIHRASCIDSGLALYLSLNVLHPHSFLQSTSDI
jgi:hypothetical protein